MTYFTNNIIVFYFLILIKVQFISNNIYKIPFGLFNSKDLDNTLDMIDNIFYNLIYVNLSIGIPPQIISFSLNINSQTFFVPNKIYNKNESSSYESVSKNEISYEYEDVSNGFNSKDILNLNNNTKQKINFILGTKFENINKNLGIIGLRIPKRVQFGVYPFFQSLRNAGFISSYSWTLKYFDNISLIDTIVYNKNKNNIIGEFIFGDEPHNYEDDKVIYNVNEYSKVSPLSSSDGFLYWDIEFNSIYFINKESQNEDKEFSKIIVQGNKKAQIIPDIGFIISPIEFFDQISNNFFNDYFKQNICRKNKIDLYLYDYIECNYNSLFRVSSFPTLSLEHLGFESIFNLTYKDLFVVDKKNNKYIFLIFNKEHFHNWVLGTIFLRKFQFVFNGDYKTIGYYKSNNYYKANSENKSENLNKNNKINKKKYIILLILLFIFSVLLVLFGMFCQRQFFNKNRKIRANELEENFSYESNFNTNKNINKKTKIIKEEEKEDKYHSI